MMSRKQLSGKLEALLAREDLTIEDLVAGADGLLAELAPRQSRYKVAERPDVRTIRYYTTQKLLPRPVSYEAGRARYSGAHLIRLLLIKKLQAEHHTLRKIARQLEGLSDRQVLTELTRNEAGPLTVGTQPTHMEWRAPGGHGTARAMRRIPLPGGGSIDVPESAFRDRTRREEVADRLSALARSLRDGTPWRDNGKDGNTGGGRR